MTKPTAELPIRYVHGDATALDPRAPAVLAHVCNDWGLWGRGFSWAVTARWPGPERDYRAWSRRGPQEGFVLGATRLIQVEERGWVANMVAQHGVRGRGNPAPVRYDALERCLRDLAVHARELGAAVQMPRIGCGLAGGRWEQVEPLVVRELTGAGIPVTVYDLQSSSGRV